MKKRIIIIISIVIVFLISISCILIHNKNKYNGVWEAKDGYLALSIYDNVATYSIGEDFTDFKVTKNMKSLILKNEDKDITCKLLSNDKLYCKTIGTLQKRKWEDKYLWIKKC